MKNSITKKIMDNISSALSAIPRSLSLESKPATKRSGTKSERGRGRAKSSGKSSRVVSLQSRRKPKRTQSSRKKGVSSRRRGQNGRAAQTHARAA
jgi:hypothetical protein